MNCQDFEQRLDDYLDAALDAAGKAEVDVHVADCAGCRARLERARGILAAVRDYGRTDIVVPGDAWFDLAVSKAAWRSAKRDRRRRWGTGAAVAAGLAIWLFAALLTRPGDMPPAAVGIPSVAMTIDEPRTVRLVFSSTVALPDATLTVTLPEGLELAGFSGQREITWSTSLTPGRNVLALELIATSPVGGEVYATLRHADEQKTFRLRVDIDHDASLLPGLGTEIIA